MMVKAKAKALRYGLVRSAIYKKLMKDASRYAKQAVKAANNIDWDKETWLNRAGLSSYSPAKRTFGGLGLFVLGGAIGAAVGMLLAPKPGSELRTDVKDRAMDLISRGQALGNETQAEA